VVKRRNRKLETVIDATLSNALTGVQYYRTTLSNSLGYTDGFASSIWPMGTAVNFHNTGTSTGGDFGELNKLNYDNVIELYTPDNWAFSMTGSFLSGSGSSAPSGIVIPVTGNYSSSAGISEIVSFTADNVPRARQPTWQYATSSLSGADGSGYLQEGKEGFVEFQFSSSGNFSAGGWEYARGLQFMLMPSGSDYSIGTSGVDWVVSTWKPSASLGLCLGDVFPHGSTIGGTGSRETYRPVQEGQVDDTYASWYRSPTMQTWIDPAGPTTYNTRAIGLDGGNVAAVKYPERRLTSSLQNKRFRIFRKKGASLWDGADYSPWSWNWQIQNDDGCWVTWSILTARDASIIGGGPMTPAESKQLMTQSYYPIVAFTENSVQMFEKTSSCVDASIGNIENYSWTRSQYSSRPTASLTYCYPSGFITNDTDTYRTNIYKDYGLMWSVANDRERVRGSIRYPWYNSYEEYSSDIRYMGKEYSIIPEYRVSEHMDDIISLDANKTNFGFLTLDGAEITSSGEGFFDGVYGAGTNDDFFEDHSNSDFQSDLGAIVSDHESIGAKQSKFTISCDAILKLLPYEGFYPITRTTQIATIFADTIDVSSSADGYNVELYKYDNNNQCWQVTADTGSLTYANNPQFRGVRRTGLTEPLFGPGILYNSIKSGISVGWTVATSSNIQNTYKMYNMDPAAQGGLASWDSSSVLEHAFLNTTIYHNPEYATKIPFDALWNLAEFPKADPNSDIAGAYHINYPEALSGYLSSSALLSVSPVYTSNENFMTRTKELATKGKNYELAINNFLAETVAFFLKSGKSSGADAGKLTSFKSATAQQIANHAPKKGNTYYMNIELSMDKKWTMCESYHNEDNLYYNQMPASSSGVVNNFGPADITTTTDIPINFSCSYNGRYFGPSTEKWKNYWNGTEPVSGAHYNVCDPAQAPYTPPYYYGTSILTLEYTVGDEWSDLTQNPFVTMFDRITASYSNDGILNKISEGNLNKDAGASKFGTGSFAYLMAQNVDDSIDWRGTINKTIPQVRSLTETTMTAQFDPTAASWIISPKWECPVLNFKNQNISSLAVSGGLHPTCSFSASGGFLDGTPIGLGRGMWSGYGELGSDDEGLRITLAETPSRPTAAYNNSLLRAMGFVKVGEPTTKTLGKLSTKRTLSEAVVAIPYVDSSVTGVTTDRTDSYYESFVNKFFFSINENEIYDNGEVRYDRADHLGDLLRNMRKFVIPPQFDFIKIDKSNKPPIAMYILPFETILDRGDLQDIWQGVLPNVGITPQKRNSAISHDLGADDPFYRGQDIPTDVRWMVFRVKQKAHGDYSEITETTLDESSLSSQDKYTYNWPYDFCSLVELGKIQTSFKIKK
tara:strand:- start:10618 stop:14682 length:4065 start_codon:yes stop_codon:yes gene_type:complete